MRRTTLFTVSIDDLNKLDNLVVVTSWAKNKIFDVLTVLSDGDCCKEELRVVAIRLEQAMKAGEKALEHHE